MFRIGYHMSTSKGLYKTAVEAKESGANTFQFFTRNPRGGKAKEIDQDDIKKLNSFMEENEFAHLAAHASYTMNLCSDKENIRNFAKTILKDDLNRVGTINKCYYVFHPGSHVKQGREKGVEYIAEALNECTDLKFSPLMLLETMSGKGTEIGKNFEEINLIIEKTDYRNIGICIDICHLYSAGYDIKNDLEGVLEDISSITDMERIKVVHLNDSMEPFGSAKDRHEKIGKGTIGKDAFINIINNNILRNKVFILETPNEKEGYMREIEFLKNNYKGE